MTSFMALDGVTSFLRLKAVTFTCKHMRRSLSIYKRGVCRPLDEESSFCLGLSTRPVSEIVPVCLNPRFFSSHYFVVMRFLEK